MASVVRGLNADNECLPNIADIDLPINFHVGAALAAPTWVLNFHETLGLKRKGRAEIA
jgi:hypothetical protein